MTRSATIVALLAAFLVAGTFNCAAAMRLHCNEAAMVAAHKCCGPAFERAASCCCHAQTEHVQALRSVAPGSNDPGSRVVGTVETGDVVFGGTRGAPEARRMRWPDPGLAPPESLLQQHTLLLL